MDYITRIEHLDPEVLESLPRIIFGIYRPKICVITTPNAEFNVHFPNLNYGSPESSFRHWDHRFEWTRREFEDWANSQKSDLIFSVIVV